MKHYRILKCNYGDSKSINNVYRLQWKRFLFWHYFKQPQDEYTDEIMGFSTLEEAKKYMICDKAYEVGKFKKVVVYEE